MNCVSAVVNECTFHMSGIRWLIPFCVATPGRCADPLISYASRNLHLAESPLSSTFYGKFDRFLIIIVLDGQIIEKAEGPLNK